MSERPPRAARILEFALLFTFVAHAAAMLGMATFLLPGMPGGSSTTPLQRVGYVADHPWLWRTGWAGWQITALSDLLLAIALLWTRWIRRPIAMLTVLLTGAALLPDQIGQAMWSWHGPRLAAAALAAGDLRPYLVAEARLFRWVAGWGGLLYLCAALGWTWCFVSAGTWSRRLTWLSIGTWGLFAASLVVIFVPASVHVPAALSKAVSGANAIAFVLLLVWLADVAELVLRRSRPATPHGAWAVWRYPRAGVVGFVCDLAANSRFVRAVFEWFPTLAMKSDITDVVYINYLVPADRLEPLVSSMLRLQRLPTAPALAMFSILVYRHGHFGPRCFGRLRRWWASPIQSNWRVYVTDPATGRTGVHFITTAITSRPHALAARVLSEGVPMHVPAEASIERKLPQTVAVRMTPGRGTAPDLDATLTRTETTGLSGVWASAFDSWAAMLTCIVPQDRAIAPQPWYGRVARQEITLGISLADCLPLAGVVHSVAASAVVGDATPVCFMVERVAFGFEAEAYDRRQDEVPL